MIRIKCPFCGERDHNEFTYAGDATKIRPENNCSDMGAWINFVYIRDNPKGPHFEYWHHTHGCRQWLIVERDTITHEVIDVRLAKPSASGVV